MIDFLLGVGVTLFLIWYEPRRRFEERKLRQFIKIRDRVLNRCINNSGNVIHVTPKEFLILCYDPSE